MPSTRSSAATKCISEVPGLAKQTSTPPATKVRTRLSAPFIVALPFATFLEYIEDQSFLAHFVKGFAGIAAIATAAVPFLTQHLKIAALTRPWLAKSRQLWPVSRANRFSGGRDDPGFCFAVCGGDTAGRYRRCASPGLRHARYHGWRPHFQGHRFKPDSTHDRGLCEQLFARHH